MTGKTPSRVRSSRAILTPILAASLAGAVAACAADSSESAPLSGGSDGARIAFHADPGGQDDLFVINADGRKLRRLTFGLEQIATALWSPDGKRLAFLARPTGASDIYVTNSDGSVRKRLTGGQGDHYDLAWSPDGKRLAFSCCDETAPGIFVVAADGTDRRQLAPNAGLPSWSPDGKQIAFISFRDGDVEIYVMKADGSGQRRLTRSRGEDANAAWSPDGSRLAFNSRRDGNDEIYVMEADGSRLQRLTASKANDQQPRWSPDGKQILFTSFRNRDPLLRGIGDAEIVIASTDGSRKSNLTRSGFWEGDPTWSPDGKRIAFAIRRDFGPRGTFQLALMNSDGSNRRTLPSVRHAGLPANNCCPAWEP